MDTFQQYQNTIADIHEEMLNEFSLSRLQTHVHGRNIGLISAERGAHHFPDKSADEVHEMNAKNTDELEQSIKKAGYGYKKVKGRYVEGHGTPEAKNVDEHSFLVMGKKGPDQRSLHKFLTKHGKKYNQDSILHKPHDSTHAHLTGTNKSPFPGLGKKADMGTFHANRMPEFHTVLHPSKGASNAAKPKHQTNPSPKTFSFEH